MLSVLAPIFTKPLGDEFQVTCMVKPTQNMCSLAHTIYWVGLQGQDLFQSTHCKVCKHNLHTNLPRRGSLCKQSAPEPIAVKTNSRRLRKARRFSWGFHRRDGNAATVNSAHAAVMTRRITAPALAMYITSTSSHTCSRPCHIQLGSAACNHHAVLF